MGVDLDIYRIRIGTYSHSNCKSNPKRQSAHYSPYTKSGNVIHYRIFASFFFVSITYLLGVNLVLSIRKGLQNMEETFVLCIDQIVIGLPKFAMPILENLNQKFVPQSSFTSESTYRLAFPGIQ